MVDSDSLVGTSVTFHDPSGSFFHICIAAIGILLLLAVMTMQPGFAFAAVWPACYVLVSFLRRGPTQDLVFQQNGVLFDYSGREVPYASIQGLTLNGEIEPGSSAFMKTGTLELISSHGVLFVGSSLDAGKAYEFLLQQVPDSGSRNVSVRMSRHLEEQLAAFDHDLVSSFCARGTIGSPRSNVLRAGLTMLLAAGLLLPLCVSFPSAGGWAAGYFAAGFFFSLIGFFDRSVRMRPPGMTHWAGSSLIISPWGIAVEQGDLVGKMRWDEIRKLECGAPLRSFQLSRGPRRSINITIKGASFMIHDLYDRPLAGIYDQMLEFWEAGQEEEPAA